MVTTNVQHDVSLAGFDCDAPVGPGANAQQTMKEKKLTVMPSSGMKHPTKELPRRFYRMFRPSRVNLWLFPVHRYAGLCWLLCLVYGQWVFWIEPLFFSGKYSHKIHPNVVDSNATSATSVDLTGSSHADLVLIGEAYAHRSLLFLVWPLLGVVQAVTASYYFRFELPKKVESGYLSFGDQGRASWYFVCEAIFFNLCLCFHSWYVGLRAFDWENYCGGLWAPFFNWLKANWLITSGELRVHTSLAQQEMEVHSILGPFSSTVKTIWMPGPLVQSLEMLVVFLAYWWRPLFPKTSMRESSAKSHVNVSSGNHGFYEANTSVVKIFYLFAKFYIQFCQLQVLFLDRVDYRVPQERPLEKLTSSYEADLYLLHGMLINGMYMTTFAIFLHTLVFKKILSNKQGVILYEIAYPGAVLSYGLWLFGTPSFSGVRFVRPLWQHSWDLVLLNFVALLLNVCSMRFWHLYQGLLMLLCLRGRQIYYAELASASMPSALLAATSAKVLPASLASGVQPRHLLEALWGQWGLVPSSGNATSEVDWAALVLRWAVVVAVCWLSQAVPQWCRQHNLFEKYGEKLKLLRPHREDDPPGMRSKFDGNLATALEKEALDLGSKFTSKKQE